MFEKLIKAELKKRGLDAEKYLSRIKVEKEDEIEQAVFDLKLSLKVEEHKNKELDQAITTAIDTYKKNHTEELDKLKADWEKDFKEKHGINDDKDKDPDELKMSENEKIFRSMIQKISDTVENQTKTLNERLDKIDKSKEQENTDKSVIAALKEAEVDEGWRSSITATEPEKIKEQVDALKERLDKIKQDNVDDLIKDGNITKRSDLSETTVESVVKDVAEAKNKGQSGRPENEQFRGKLAEKEPAKSED